jgi:hypothetical protein
MINIVKKFEQFNMNYVYYCEPIKNNVINEGNFIRIIYSTPLFSLNSINLLVSLNNIVTEKYFNKNKCLFEPINHKNIIENIKYIEEKLLTNSNVKHKIPQYKIYEQMKNGHIKIFSEYENELMQNFILKISGIWETEYHYGLTYKFIHLRNSPNCRLS